MKLKTFDKSTAIHVSNLFSMVMAWGVTCYFFDSLVTNKTIEAISNFLMTPVMIVDRMLELISIHGISGDFLSMFLVLWVSFAIPLSRCYKLFMITHHDEEDLREWYRTVRS